MKHIERCREIGRRVGRRGVEIIRWVYGGYDGGGSKGEEGYMIYVGNCILRK